MMMRTLEQDLYYAFNPVRELISTSPLTRLLSPEKECRLTVEECMVEYSMIRQKLKEQLSDADYRLLKLYFRQSLDLELLQLELAPIRSLVKKEAKIYAPIPDTFLDLCCACEFWNVNVFVPKYYNYMKCHVPASQHPALAGRRRRRIAHALARMKADALIKAEQVLEKSEKK